MTLSRAELAAMPRTTPTALAEAAYAGRAAAAGPREGRVPELCTVYRPTIDQKLLRQIGDASVDMLERRMLPADEAANVADALSAELLVRFPADEMAILEQWNFAWPHDAVFVQLLSAEQMRVPLPAPLTFPRAVSTDFSANPAKAGFPIPPGTADFFARADEVAQARAAVRWRLGVWPGQFRNNAKRWPRWGEIAAGWPLIAAWFDAQQAGGAAA